MKKKELLKSIILIAFYAALISVFAQVSIPFGPVPFTLQTLAVCLTGMLLGYKKGLIAILVYITLGIIGVPVFASFKGGISTLFNVTGGFIFGFIPLTVLSGIGDRCKNIFLKFLFFFLGMVSCYLIGTMQYAIITSTPFFASFMIVSLSFIYFIKDMVVIVIAYFVVIPLKKALKIEDVQ